MCSIYIFQYDCGCTHQEDGIVPCAKQGTIFCDGVKEQFRRRIDERIPQEPEAIYIRFLGCPE
ncbi:uncharacterized protein N7515_007313 [Penicillium bovifimosum]|uniref:Uncharacterized protein n=1 Tax=Penicillium bovifimosum TaxID=126998 RepID=A0A9W9GXX2_9EURO|nr:uncharacterized protein N7515_007313 [Penicillium bovifimosum]KAJ5131274.1 hypothetical protein N7515_007313 [Penicillium bovifimosum]